MNESNSSKKDFWEIKYLNNTTPWDIGEPAPSFVKYFNGLANKKVAVIGCGRGHDAFFLSNPKGEVYGFDFSRTAIDYCKKKKEESKLSNIYFYETDFFELLNEKKWKSYFDYVIEHTSLCAIDPVYRKKYAELISYLLKPGGKLVGLFFIRPEELSGPPHGIAKEDLRSLLKKDFTEVENLHIAECLHNGKLTGDEYFGVFEKNPVQ